MLATNENFNNNIRESISCVRFIRLLTPAIIALHISENLFLTQAVRCGIE